MERQRGVGGGGVGKKREMRLLKSPKCRELDHTNSVFAKCKEACRPKPTKAVEMTDVLEQRD